MNTEENRATKRDRQPSPTKQGMAIINHDNIRETPARKTTQHD